MAYELSEGVIRSAERMTYTDVNLLLEGDAGLRERYAPLVPTFELMRDLAMMLNRKRQRRGSIDFDLPEPVIEFDEFGLMKSITHSERNIANRLIEEFMLAANESVAQYLEAKRIASLYRIHEKPDAKRVYDFEVLAATFGYSLGIGPLPIQRVQFKSDRRAARGTGKSARTLEIPKDVHITPRMYQKLTEKIAGKPEERILSYLMLRSLKQARYSEENVGHFALASSTYTHFTSPIRRYPDLIVHRILKNVLRNSAEKQEGNVPVGVSSEAENFNDASPWSKRRDHTAHREAREPLGGPISEQELHEIAEESSQSERRADDAERELMEWKKVKFMQDRVGEEFDGLITSVTKFGFFVELTDLFVEGLVPLNTLTDDVYTYHENTRQIIGQRSRKTYSLGQKIRVLLDRIDPGGKEDAVCSHRRSGAAIAQAIPGEIETQTQIDDPSCPRANCLLRDHCHQHPADADPAARYSRSLLDQRRCVASAAPAAHNAATRGSCRSESAGRLPLSDRHDVALRTRARARHLRLALRGGCSRCTWFLLAPVRVGLRRWNCSYDVHVKRCDRCGSYSGDSYGGAQGESATPAISVCLRIHRQRRVLSLANFKSCESRRFPGSDASSGKLAHCLRCSQRALHRHNISCLTVSFQKRTSPKHRTATGSKTPERRCKARSRQRRGNGRDPAHGLIVWQRSRIAYMSGCSRDHGSDLHQRAQQSIRARSRNQLVNPGAGCRAFRHGRCR